MLVLKSAESSNLLKTAGGHQKLAGPRKKFSLRASRERVLPTP